jgi:hypothetical protein
MRTVFSSWSFGCEELLGEEFRETQEFVWIMTERNNKSEGAQQNALAGTGRPQRTRRELA